MQNHDNPLSRYRWRPFNFPAYASSSRSGGVDESRVDPLRPTSLHLRYHLRRGYGGQESYDAQE